MHRDAPPGSLPHLPSALEARLRSPTRAPARPEPRTEAKRPEPRRDQSRASQAVPRLVLAPPPRRREHLLSGRDQNRPSRTPQRHVFHPAGSCRQAARERRGTRRPVEAQGPEVTGTGKARARIKNSPSVAPRGPLLIPHARRQTPTVKQDRKRPSRRSPRPISHPARKTAGPDRRAGSETPLPTDLAAHFPSRTQKGPGPTVGRDQKRAVNTGLGCVSEPAGGTGRGARARDGARGRGGRVRFRGRPRHGGVSASRPPQAHTACRSAGGATARWPAH